MYLSEANTIAVAMDSNRQTILPSSVAKQSKKKIDIKMTEHDGGSYRSSLIGGFFGYHLCVASTPAHNAPV